MAINKRLFSGFASSLGLKSIYDIDLIKQDLLNEFNTRKGERLMDPEFGSIIWDLLFELKSETVYNQIREDIVRIVGNDRRVRLDTLEITEQEHGYVAFARLHVNNLNIVDEFRVEFNRNLRQAVIQGNR